MSIPYTPRPYQKLITRHLLDHPRAAAWIFMGAGKTAATLDALKTLSIVEPGPTLVIAPLRVARSVWSDEAKKWEEFESLKVSAVVGAPHDRKAALSRKADIFTVNFEVLPWLLDALKNDWPFRKVVWDEASKLRGVRASEQISPKTGKTFIRAVGSERTKGLAQIIHKKIPYFIELTGTPSPNGLKNLWGQLWMLDKGQRLGRTYTSFMQRWFTLGYDGYTVTPLPHAEKEIHEKVKDICMSLDPKEWFDVQEPVVKPIYVDMPDRAHALYRDMEKSMYMVIQKEGIEAVNAGAKIMKCRQIASGAAYHDWSGLTKTREFTVLHDEKIMALQSVIEEANGMPVIIAYDFKADLIRLKKAFPHGRHLNTKKDEDDFKAGEIDLLFMHFKSAGHGIDGFQYITNIIAIMSPDWNLEDLDQGIARIGGIRQLQAGFDRPVFVYPIVARNTIDEDVMERWATKRSVQDILLAAMKRS